MKKPYGSPKIAIERFVLTQHLASCSGIKISLLDMDCVSKDPDAPPFMKDMAEFGVFMDGCAAPPTGLDQEDGICYNTSVIMAFSS